MGSRRFGRTPGRAVAAGLAVALAAAPQAGAAGAPRVRTAAGSFGPATPRDVSMTVRGLAVSGSTVYAADFLFGVVRAFDTSLRRTWVAAGTGNPTVSGRTGPATRISVGPPSAVAAVPGGGFVVAGGGYVHRVDRAGNATVVAGGGMLTGAGVVGRRGTDIALRLVGGVAAGADGTVYVADTPGHRVLAITPDGRVQLVAGTGVAANTGPGGPALAVSLSQPNGLAVTPAGDLLVADTGNNRVVRVDRLGLAYPFAGADGQPGNDGNGGPAPLAHLTAPAAVTVARDGAVLVGDTRAIRRVAPDGTITTFVPAGSSSVAAAPNGDVYYTSAGRVLVRRADGRTLHAAGKVSTRLGFDAFGDGLPARLQTYRPLSVATYRGTLYWTDDSAVAWRLRGGRAAVATSNDPPFFDPGTPDPLGWELVTDTTGLAVSPAGRVYVTDAFAERVYVLTARGRRPVAGRSRVCIPPVEPDDLGDGKPALDALLCAPQGVAATSTTVYVADSGHNRIRAIGADGRMRTVAGAGSDWGGGHAGDGGRAYDAQLDYPMDVAPGPDGSLYVADTHNGVIRRIDRRGIITTIAGRPDVFGYAGDGGPARSALFDSPSGIAVARDGTVYVADEGNSVVRRIRGGVVTTVAGNGSEGFSGDGGPARSAQLGCPRDVAVDDAAGLLYVADTCNNRVRVVEL